MRIGRVTKEIMDVKREETLSQLSGKRKFMISIFYSVNKNIVNHQKPYYLNLFSPHQDKALQIFKDIGANEEYLSNLNTDCYIDAPITRTKEISPIIIYSPGMGVDRDMYFFNISQLVRAGYIVITVGPTYETLFTVFPEKEDVVYQSEIVNNISSADFTALKNLLDIRIADITYVINSLSNWNKTDPLLKGRMDLDSIGAIGHSLGGTTIYELAQKDQRIKAGIILDGSLHLITDEKHMNTPFMSIRQQHSSLEELKKIWDEKAAEVYCRGQQTLYDSLSEEKYFLKIPDSNHMSFSDIPLILHEKNNNKMHVSEIHQSINELTIAFFNEFLKGKSNGFTKMLDKISQIDREGELFSETSQKNHSV